MAAIAFDTLAYVRRVVAGGVPREQAEAQADAMKEAFVHNIDALVTRDYLDTRFTEFETRVEANMDRRFTAMEINVDKRFTAMEKRFVEMDVRMDSRFADFRLEMHGEIGGVRGEIGDVRGEIGDVRMEIGDVRGEIRDVRGEIGDVRMEIGDVSGEIGDVRIEIGELRGTLKLHSWMLALLVAGVLLPVVERLAGLL
jgi:hypothetical protein